MTWATVATLIDFAAPDATDPGAALRCAFGPALHTLVAHQPEQVRPLLAQVERAAQQGCWCVGYLRYEAAAAFDSAFEVHAPDGPLAWFGVYAAALPWPAIEPGAAARAQWSSGLARADFDRQLERIARAIEAGELYQVNYTASLHGELQGDALALFQALQRAQPGGYAAYIDSGDEQLLSVSPELFFHWKDNQLLMRPIKGTAARGADPSDDARQAERLRASPKERAENVMIVDLIRNDVSRLALPHSVAVPHLFGLTALPTVWQMSSDVRARTRAGTTLADVFAALFPCGSVTGAPKVQAMRMIHALEPQPRGVYCGAIGVLRPGGAATFNVAIRSVSARAGRLRCGIGSGITADASASGEWAEWQHKRAFLERASAPFELLQTLALQDGAYDHAPAHLERMARAAAHFGYPWPDAAVRAALHALAVQHPQGAWRLRLRLDAQAQVHAEAFPLEATPTPVRLQLAASAFEAASSEFVRFKTTRRAHYDAAAASTDPTLFDTVLWNPRGELTECTRANLALLIDGRWVTPALHCGLLDGVGRAHWLRQGRLVEAVVHLDDLPRVQAWAWINSLRGWLAAECVGAKPE